VELNGTVALITGGKRIGAVVAAELARGGADVATVYHASGVEAEETAATVRALGRRAIAIKADLRQPEDCARVVADTVQSLGRLDVLVSMASLYHSIPVDRLTLAHWDDQMHVDLRSSYLCAQAALPHMRKAGQGRIINFSDWVSRSGRPRYPGYLTYYT
jgi:3-oxoacyl-[acyl-carrier protein] reductase